MASLRDIKKRIASVKNTQKTTKAMKMVSAAKLRRAQQNIQALRPYAHELNKVIQGLSQDLGDETHPLLTEPKERKKILTVLVTSDRGLCGGFNANIIKAGSKILEDASKYEKFDFAFIGKKGFEFFKSRKEGKYYEEYLVDLDFTKSRKLADELIDLYLTGEYDEIRFVFNEFKSAISQIMTQSTFLPVGEMGETETSGDHGDTIYEPSAREVLDQILPKHFAVFVHRIFLESIAGEHAARMASMDSATKNAGEMIDKLTLEFNKSRQAAITKELLEITSGSEALKG